MDYKKIGQEVLVLLGGKDNIQKFTNCMTRLRVTVKDKEKVQFADIKAINGVMGIVDAGEQIQIIFGPGHAQRMRDAFEVITGMKADAQVEDEFEDVAGDTKAKVKASQTASWQKGFQHIGNIFIPLIPGFVACGLIMGLTNMWKLADPSIVGNEWFLLLAAIGGLVFGSMHIIVGYNAGKEFGGTPILGAIAGALIYSPAMNGIPETATSAAVPLYSINLFDHFTIMPQSGLGGVIGVVLAAFVFVQIEKRVRKVVPAWLDLFLVPLVTILVGSVITVFVVMPISAILMSFLTWLLVDVALYKGGIIGGYLLAATFLPLVMLGIHQGLTPIHAQLIQDTGYTILLPILACAGAGQVGMAIAVYLKTKNKKLKGVIGSALPVGFMGIGEPLIYGVSLPLFYPFITAGLGAGFGGAVIAFVSIHIAPVGAISIGPSGLLLTPLIADGMWYWYLLGLCAAYAGGFLLTYFFGFKESMLERMKQ